MLDLQRTVQQPSKVNSTVQLPVSCRAPIFEQHSHMAYSCCTPTGRSLFYRQALLAAMSHTTARVLVTSSCLLIPV